jgi:hypothetical protein
MRDTQKIPTISQLLSVVALVVTGTIVWACAEAPTKPKSPALVASISRSAVMAAREVATPLIDDASGRLATAVEDATSRGQLRSFLTALSSALEKGDSRGAREQIGRLRKLIEARVDAPDAADFAAIGLALDQVESQLNSATQPDK